jgi:hypothetical protein
MEYFVSLLLEVVAEVIGLLLVSLYFIYKKRVSKKALNKLRKELDLERLNNSETDEVLLINSMLYLNDEEGMKKFNNASVVLLSNENNMYNTVIKNNYGSSGIIKK